MAGSTSGGSGPKEGRTDGRLQGPQEAHGEGSNSTSAQSSQNERQRRPTPGAQGLAALMANRGQLGKLPPAKPASEPPAASRPTPPDGGRVTPTDLEFESVEVTAVGDRGAAGTGGAPSESGHVSGARTMPEDSGLSKLLSLRRNLAADTAGKPAAPDRHERRATPSGFESVEITAVGGAVVEPRSDSLFESGATFMDSGRATSGASGRTAPVTTSTSSGPISGPVSDPFETTAVSGPIIEPDAVEDLSLSDLSGDHKTDVDHRLEPTKPPLGGINTAETVRVRNPMLPDAASPRPTHMTPSSGRIAALLAQARTKSGRFVPLETAPGMAGGGGLGTEGLSAAQAAPVDAAGAASPGERKRASFAATLLGVPAPASPGGETQTPGQPGTTAQLVFGADQPPEDSSGALAALNMAQGEGGPASGGAGEGGAWTDGSFTGTETGAFGERMSTSDHFRSDIAADAVRPGRRTTRKVVFTALGAAIAIVGTTAVLQHRQRRSAETHASPPASAATPSANANGAPAGSAASAPLEPVVEPVRAKGTAVAGSNPSAVSAGVPAAASPPGESPPAPQAAEKAPSPFVASPPPAAAVPANTAAATRTTEPPASAARTAEARTAEARTAEAPTAEDRPASRAADRAAEKDRQAKTEREAAAAKDSDKDQGAGAAAEAAPSGSRAAKSGGESRRKSSRSESRQSDSPKKKKRSRNAEARARHGDAAAAVAAPAEPSKVAKPVVAPKAVEPDPDGTLPLTR